MSCMMLLPLHDRLRAPSACSSEHTPIRRHTLTKTCARFTHTSTCTPCPTKPSMKFFRGKYFTRNRKMVVRCIVLVAYLCTLGPTVLVHAAAGTMLALAPPPVSAGAAGASLQTCMRLRGGAGGGKVKVMQAVCWHSHNSHISY